MARSSVAESPERVRDAAIFLIEQSILRELEIRHRHFLGVASRLVGERLAPIDPRAAELFLDDVRQGRLP